MPSNRQTPRNVSPDGATKRTIRKAKEQVAEQQVKTLSKQHEHEGPETRNTENRGPTAKNRGK